MRSSDKLLKRLLHIRAYPKLEKRLIERTFIKHAQYDTFAVHRRKRRYAQIDLSIANHQQDSAILRKTGFCYVQIRENLDPRGHCKSQAFRGFRDLVTATVNPVSYGNVTLKSF